MAWINPDTTDKGDFTMHENDPKVYKVTPETSDRMELEVSDRGPHR